VERDIWLVRRPEGVVNIVELGIICLVDDQGEVRLCAVNTQLLERYTSLLYDRLNAAVCRAGCGRLAGAAALELGVQGMGSRFLSRRQKDWDLESGHILPRAVRGCPGRDASHHL
jgi:hypothetical protein